MAPRSLGRTMAAKEVPHMTDSRDLSLLAGEKYLSITTFRRDGSEASTPVWFVSDDLERRLFVATGADTWKVRRIKRNAHVRVAGCSARGKVHGETVEGKARLVDEEELVRRLQYEKYGFQKRLIEAAYRLVLGVTRKSRPEEVFIEVIASRDAVEARAA
jgi:PPOX class probable F420-dependent enzyme